MNKPLQYGNQPSLASLVELLQKNIMSVLNCHQVGEIVSFNASNQTAEVSVKMTYKVNDKVLEYPLLIDCPCVVLGGGKGRVTFPITAGDSCIVLFNDRDIDNWFSSGQTMPPRTERKHSFSDAIAIVGVRNMQNKITDYLTTGTELKYGDSTIKLESGKITITNQLSTVVMNRNTVTMTAPIVNITGNVNVVQNNVDGNSLHAYIIDSYKSGNNWYRLYSDKWCEQGGYLSSGSSNTITFLKPYSSAPSVFFGNITTRSGASYDKELYPNSVTNTNFKYVNIVPGGGIGCGWKAEGYVS